MNKKFELAKSYPPEVAVLAHEGFALCCGVDRFLEEWTGLGKDVMTRRVIPTPIPAVGITKLTGFGYVCQSRDLLMAVRNEEWLMAGCTKGVICSKTISLGDSMAHLTSEGCLNIYGEADGELQILAVHRLPTRRTQRNSLVALNGGLIAYQNSHGQLDQFDTELGGSVRATTLSECSSPVTDILCYDQNILATLIGGQLVLLDTRSKGVCVRFDCPGGSLRGDLSGAGILFDSDNNSISSYRLGYPARLHCQLLNRAPSSRIGSFEVVAPEWLLLVNDQSATVELYSSS